jgi:NAD(P)H-hydrate epimerase
MDVVDYVAKSGPSRLVDLPLGLYRAEQVRALDRLAIDEQGIPGGVLMERAGLAAFEACRQRWPHARRIAVVCGVGNNGGDGYVMARRAAEAGLDVRVCQLGDVSRLRGDALQTFQRMQQAGLETTPFAADALSWADVVVDAIFGTGLDREVTGPWAEALTAIGAAGTPVLAIDIPSGLHADTGSVLGAAVRAELSISFIGLKQGMFTNEGREYSGTILFDDLAVPVEVYRRFPPAAQRISYSQLASLLMPRARSAHKGNFGHVLVIGGDHGYAGAARLAAEAAARVGAGLVTLATRSSHAAAIIATRPELMCHAVDAPEQLLPLLDRATVLAVGPGLGQSAWAESLLSTALAARQPLVIDADALNLMARAATPWGGDAGASQRWVLTPHPGEAARLLGCSPRAVQVNRFAAVQALVERFGGICVLKGSGTLVLEAGGEMAVADGGNPGMAVGGMGDVLTGIIAGLAAQGLPLAEAARLGVCLHAQAGDEAAAAGERGLLASDLLATLRTLVNPPLVLN